MDSTDKAALTLIYFAIAAPFGAYVLCETGTGGILYQRTANKDPTGILESDIVRGIVQVGKATLGMVAWPMVLLNVIGRDSRMRS